LNGLWSLTKFLPVGVALPPINIGIVGERLHTNLSMLSANDPNGGFGAQERVNCINIVINEKRFERTDLSCPPNLEVGVPTKLS